MLRSWLSMKRHNKNLEFKRNPDFNEYIIILPPAALSGKGCIGKIKKCLTKRYIENLEDNIIGKLHIITKFSEALYPKCECCQKEHTISDFVKPYSLLIKLPKEKIFVQADKWDLMYLKSQITELQDILMYLGAYEIEFSVYNSNCETNMQGVGADISIYGINVGGDVEIEHGEEKTDSICGKIIFKKPSLNINILLDNNKFHYLPLNHDWQHMVNQRLQSSIGSYKVTTTVSNNSHINTSAQVYLDKLGVNFRHKHSNANELVINMSALFCEMTPFQKESCNLIPVLSQSWTPRYSTIFSNSNKNRVSNGSSDKLKDNDRDSGNNSNMILEQNHSVTINFNDIKVHAISPKDSNDTGKLSKI